MGNSIIGLNLRTPADPVARSGAGSQPNAGANVGARTDVGLLRANNEDSFLIVPEMHLHVLSDGMGGMASGEIASRLTVETVVAHLREATANPSLAYIGECDNGVSETAKRLASGIQLANRVVHKAAQDFGNKRKMGATVVAVHCTNGRMSVAHVGDSRAYRLRGEYLERLTQDHSFATELLQKRRGVNEGGAGTLSHLLTRAVGVEPEVNVEVRDELLMESDTVLLCSDGLTRELSDNKIAELLREANSAQEAADKLVTLANEAGGRDNVTAVVIRQVSKEHRAMSGFSRLGKWFSGRRN